MTLSMNSSSSTTRNRRPCRSVSMSALSILKGLGHECADELLDGGEARRHPRDRGPDRRPVAGLAGALQFLTKISQTVGTDGPRRRFQLVGECTDVLLRVFAVGGVDIGDGLAGRQHEIAEKFRH